MKRIESVYFIGVGGIGMSAIARYFLSAGKFVAGYDRTCSELTERLVKEGADIHYTEDVDLIPAVCLDKDTTLVVYTPAVPIDHKELVYFRTNGFKVEKRAQALGEITRMGRALCVAGTHGKTTTSTMVAHLLHQSGKGCNAFLGGISKNYGTNYLLSKQSEYVVVEADEFDRSFHALSPYISVITSAEPDHLDIYGTKEAYLESFAHYTSLIESGGVLIMHEGLEFSPRLKQDVTLYTYSRTSGDFYAQNIRVGGGDVIFDYISPLGNISNVSLGVPVLVNIENGIAAMAMAQLVGIPSEEIRQAMASFGGVDRRFDFKIKRSDLAFLSDYAHHPSEIRESALSIRALYSDKKITAVFQPHLYTRTRDFYLDFAQSLSLFDRVILLDIYPAREQPIEGVTSQLIYDCLAENVDKQMCRKEGLVSLIENLKDIEVLVMLGAGDIEEYAPRVSEILLCKNG